MQQFHQEVVAARCAGAGWDALGLLPALLFPTLFVLGSCFSAVCFRVKHDVKDWFKFREFSFSIFFLTVFFVM